MARTAPTIGDAARRDAAKKGRTGGVQALGAGRGTTLSQRLKEASRKSQPLVYPSDAAAPDAGPTGLEGLGGLAETQAAMGNPKLSRRDREWNRRRDGIKSIYDTYNESYDLNLGAARSAVENAFANAMSEIGNREGAAMGVMDQMPGTINTTYDQASASMQQQASALQAAQDASGMSGFMPASSSLAPIESAQAADRGGRLAAVPLLRTGLQGAFSRERQGATSEKDMAMADIAEREAAAAAEEQNTLRDLMLGAWQDQEAEWDEEDAEDTGRSPWGADYIGTDRGGDIIGRRPRFTEALRNGQGAGKRAHSAYNEAKAEFEALRTKGKALDSDGMRKAVNQLRKKYKRYMGAINLALVDAGYS